MVYYHHFLQNHLADQIRRMPCDISDGSGEGIEVLNQQIMGISVITNRNMTTMRRPQGSAVDAPKTESTGCS